ncbi:MULTISPECIES: hypothetical protein [unclassified Caballeronia]|uniref:hypothetical protein n=1 Tax=unclassified Caballeronia TaxID=2646786 RepID=UPI002859C7CD|nr:MULTISPECIES: hypothetical protein [unclassified Caballeronia]MDR5751365.1 hypothetical protein [Caballeronia sp. LZ024]MDR5844493.1 hypothetical protein [Caballeronia sp. LZ031]
MPEHVSVTEKRRVTEQIDRKLGVLRRWSRAIPWKAKDDGQPARDERGELVLEFFPTNIYAFCDWDGTRNSSFVRQKEGLDFKGPSRSAMTRTTHLSSRLLVEEMFRTLKARANHQLLRANKADLINRLLGERSWQRKLIQQQETEIAVLLDEVAVMEVEIEREKKTRRSNEEELLGRIEKLEKRNAELSSIARKIAPLQSM